MAAGGCQTAPGSAPERCDGGGGALGSSEVRAAAVRGVSALLDESDALGAGPTQAGWGGRVDGDEVGGALGGAEAEGAREAAVLRLLGLCRGEGERRFRW